MKLTNKDIYSINFGLNKVIDATISGKLAFKLFKIKKKVEDEVLLIKESLKGQEDNDKEVEEVLELENEIDIEKIKASELEELKLSIEDVFLLEKIIDFEEVEVE
jgi:hypothetical protein|uniref:Uncharacterized protein n=1 Tax=Siphoviridae sp. ctZUr4 TaxID=2827892 RepID=A0A8S5STP1_9CAUD|nr:MAG TPA: hypothetical protein [Siphoviridae sp. ctZUr4]